MKGLINLKNKDHKCFMWCHVRFINLTNTHPKRINKQDKEIAANSNYSDIQFPLNISNYELITNRFEMNMNVLAMKINSTPYIFQKYLPIKLLIYY